MQALQLLIKCQGITFWNESIKICLGWVQKQFSVPYLHWKQTFFGQEIFIHFALCIHNNGLLCSSASRESACNSGDLSSSLGSGRSPGEGNGNPLQYSCLENPMDGGTWQTTALGGHKGVDMTESLTWFHTLCFKEQCLKSYIFAHK